MTSPSFSAWATRPIARCGPSPRPAAARSLRSSTTAAGSRISGAVILTACWFAPEGPGGQCIATGCSGRRALSGSSSGPLLGEQLVGTDPVAMVVGNGGDDQLVGFGGVAETFQLVRDLPRG